LSVVYRVGEAGCVMRLAGSFVGDFSNAGNRLYIIKKDFFGTADRDAELAVFIFMFTSKRNRTFTVNETGYIGRIRLI
jgi:hypothetical protein